MSMAIKGLAPPADPSSRGEWYERLRVRAVACAAFMGLVVWIPASMGTFPKVFGGFARADDLQSIRTDSIKHWAFQAEDAIMSMRVQQCNLESGVAKDLYASTIQKRMADYQQLTGLVFPLPQCSDL
jgi:hypothetical protein